MADSDNPKIFIDDDWKRQAHEEKQRLAEQEKLEKEKKAAQAAETAEAAGEDQPLPPASFEILVNSFATQTMLALGMVRHPKMGQGVNLEMAKFNIDLLGVLEEKTKGNLSAEEAGMLNQVLYQLRMVFVEVSSAHAGPIGSEER
jgi:hypothetical protein